MKVAFGAVATLSAAATIWAGGVFDAGPTSEREYVRATCRAPDKAVSCAVAIGYLTRPEPAHLRLDAAGGPPKPRAATSKAWYVAESCTWTPQARRNCRTVLSFLAAFDLGHVETACKQLSRRFLAQRNIGGLTGCAAYLRRHGVSLRIEYSISSSRLRPDGGEVVYAINPPGRRDVERRYVAVTVVEHGVSKIDALTAADA
jgi:hypothetical protein